MRRIDEARDLARAIRRRQIDRRTLLKTLAGAGLMAASFSLKPRPAHAEVAMTYFSWSDYNLPIFHESFIAEHGGSPASAIFGEEEEALQKLIAGFTPDVAHPCTSNVQRWRDAGVIKPIDVARLEHWENIFPSFREIRGVQIDGEIFHVPWEWGNDSIIYREDLVDIAEESYGLFLDQRYEGRMSIFDSGETVPVIAGLIAGVANPFAMTDAELATVREVMKKMHDNMRFYWTDNTQVTQALASGELVASTGWNDMYQGLKAQSLPVRYMSPKEGLLTWVCGLSLMKDGPGDEDQKYDFLNAMLEPETGRQVVENFYYGHSNREAMKLVDPALLAELGLDNAEARIAASNFYDGIAQATRDKMNAMLEETKAGL